MIRSDEALSVRWEDVREGDTVTTLLLDVTRSRVVMTPAATKDFNPVHHDVEAARQSQGQRDIYLNTMTLHGLVDRAALEWAGPDWFVYRRRMSILASVYAESVVSVTGSVTALDDQDHRITVALEATADGVVCVIATIILTQTTGLE